MLENIARWAIPTIHGLRKLRYRYSYSYNVTRAIEIALERYFHSYSSSSSLLLIVIVQCDLAITTSFLDVLSWSPVIVQRLDRDTGGVFSSTLCYQVASLAIKSGRSRDTAMEWNWDSSKYRWNTPWELLNIWCQLQDPVLIHSKRLVPCWRLR